MWFKNTLAGCKHPTYSGLFTWKSNICKRKVPVQTQHSCWPLLARQKDPSPFRLSYATCNNAHPVQANRTVIPEFSFIKLVLVLHFPFAFVPVHLFVFVLLFSQRFSFSFDCRRVFSVSQRWVIQLYLNNYSPHRHPFIIIAVFLETPVSSFILFKTTHSSKTKKKNIK